MEKIKKKIELKKTFSTCIFCGAGKMSGEHLWPTWMHPLLGPKSESQNKYSYDSVPHYAAKVIVNNLTYFRDKQGDPRSKKIYVVCEKCNNGWMEAIEKAARPALSRLLLGDFSVLSVNEQNVINAWVAIKTIVGEFDDVARKAIPFADRESVYKNKMPPANWGIWIGKYEGVNRQISYIHKGVSAGWNVDDAENIKGPQSYTGREMFQKTTMVANGLVVHSRSASHSVLVNKYVQGFSHPSLVRIWPSPNSDVDLSLMPAASDADMEMIDASLIEYPAS